MKARSGFTFIELLLAGAILATISFGALIGIIRISGFVDRRGELMAADGYCWDVAWRLFNDHEALQGLLDGQMQDYERAPDSMNAYFEVRGAVGSADKSSRFEFLSHLQNPVCYIILSNRYDAANTAYAAHDYYDDSGVFINVNLEWGPANSRRLLVRRPETTDEDIASGRVVVFDHPVSLFCGKYSKRQVGQ